MRVLGLGARMDLRALYLALAREGHEVRVHVSDPVYSGAPDGLVQAVPDWRAELGWVGKGRDAGGIVLFERVGQGALQDELRAEGYRVVGGSALGDRLEYDRAYGQDALREAGLPVAPSHAFEDAAAAAAWLGRNPGRFVLKHFNNARATFVGDHREAAPGLAGGEFIGPDGLLEQRGHPQVVTPNDAGRDEAVASRLLEVSEELTGQAVPV